MLTGPKAGFFIGLFRRQEQLSQGENHFLPKGRDECLSVLDIRQIIGEFWPYTYLYTNVVAVGYLLIILRKILSFMIIAIGFIIGVIVVNFVVTFVGEAFRPTVPKLKGPRR